MRLYGARKGDLQDPATEQGYYIVLECQAQLQGTLPPPLSSRQCIRLAAVEEDNEEAAKSQGSTLTSYMSFVFNLQA